MVALAPFEECVEIDELGAVSVPALGTSAPGSQFLLGGDPTLPNPNLVATGFTLYTHVVKAERAPVSPPTIVQTADEFELTCNSTSGDYEIYTPLITWRDTWKAALKTFTIQVEALTMRSGFPYERSIAVDLVDINGTVVSSAISLNDTAANPASWDDVLVASLRLTKIPARNKFRVRVRINNLLLNDTFEINKIWLMLDPGISTQVFATNNDLIVEPLFDPAIVPAGTNWTVLWSATLLGTPRPISGFVGAPLALDQPINFINLTARDSQLRATLSTANMVTFKKGFIQVMTKPFAVAPAMSWRVAPRPLTV